MSQFTFASVGPITLTSGIDFVNVQYTIGAPVGAVFSQTLTQGAANTITVPSGTPTTCIIQPPSTNTLTTTLKGVSGDTGVAIHKTQPTFISLDPSVTSFVITLSAGSNQIFVFTWL
jgi:hypothetical protein